MTRTITALMVLTIIATVGINSAYAVQGDGTSHVEVDEYPFNVTILEGGSMTLHNNGEQTINFVSHGWFKGTVPANDAMALEFPIVNCGTTCFTEGMYYISDLNGGYQSTIEIVKPVPVYVEPIVVDESKVQGVASNVDVSAFPFEITILEEGTITITSDVDRVLRSDVSTIEVKAGEPFDLVLSPLLDSDNADGWYVKDMATGEYSIIHTVTAPPAYVEPTPVYVEPTPEPVAENIFAVTDEGIYNVANYEGDVDLITMQTQLANVTAQFNNSITKLAQQKVAIENHSNQLQSLNTQIVTLNGTANGVSTLEQTVLSLQLEKEALNAQILTLGNTTTSQLETITQLNVQVSDTSILDSNIANLEAQVVSLTSERDQWKQLANNWYAVAMEQLKVMVNFLGI